MEQISAWIGKGPYTVKSTVLINRTFDDLKNGISSNLKDGN